MKITLIHNQYARLSGEDVMLHGLAGNLRAHGHQVSLFLRDSGDIEKTPLGRVRAFFSGIHSFGAVRALEKQLRKEKPDVVDIQNVYPLISPWAFEVAGRLGIPVVFRCANYRLFCPNGLLLSRGQVCERCTGGREYWCALRNCEGTLAKSVGYSLRNTWARLSRVVARNTTLYAVPSQFQRSRFVDWGIPEDRIAVAPNLVETKGGVDEQARPGSYVAYAGRLSPEKGVDALAAAMRMLPDLPCRVAGATQAMPHFASDAPPNMEFLGPLGREQMKTFYSDARMLVVPSICYEAFGLVIAEAMLQRRPVIGSRIGAIPEVIDDGTTGLLFEPGNADELAAKIRLLWEHTDLSLAMGAAGQRKALSHYGPEAFYVRMIQVYEKAIAMAKQSREIAA